jgi:hypothetical protein
MESQYQDQEKFCQVVDALRPWLHEVVFAGGWAHRLHRLHVLADSPGYLPLMTKDVDVALGTLSVADTDVRDALRASGFQEAMSGDARPPITHYQLGSTGQPFYVEFLTPLRGGESKRDGTPDITEMIGGVTAQKLRHLEILMFAPWSVAIGPDNGFPLERPVSVRVPNAAAYIAQKLLVLGRRKPQSQERDILYIHDTLETFAAHLADVRAIWQDDVLRHLHPRRLPQVRAVIDARFSTVTDRVRGASAIAESVGRQLSPQTLLDACQIGLKAIFL